MKKENNFSWNQIRAAIIFILTIMCFIYIFMFDFSKQVDYQMANMTMEHLADVNCQSRCAVNTELTRVMNEVRYLTEFLSETPDLAEEARQKLYGQLKEKCGFSNVVLISADNVLYTLDHQPLMKSSSDYVERVYRGEWGMTDAFLSDVTGEEVLAFYAPVNKNGHVDGGIAGIMVVDQIVDMVATNGFNSASYNYILKSDGRVIMQTRHAGNLYNGRDYFQFLRESTDMGDEAVDELQAKMERKESGDFVLTSNRQKRIGYYAPAEFNDWFVVTLVPYTISNWYRERINVTAFYLTVKIVMIFLVQLAVIILWSKKTRKIILESKADLELEKKKLELALMHSTGTIFEYVPKEDSLTFITPPVIRETEFSPILKGISVNASAQGLVAGEDMIKWTTALKKAADGIESEPIEFAGGASLPEDTYFRLLIKPVRGGKEERRRAIGTLEDISEERRIRRSFAQEEQYRAALLSQMLAMWSINLMKQQVIACTIRGKDWLEKGKEQVYSRKYIRKICSYVHPADRDKINRLLQVNNMLVAYYTGKREVKEMFRATYPGMKEYIWMTCTISLLTEPESGNPMAFAYVRDVNEETKRKLALKYSSERDPLTELYNRRHVEERVEQALEDTNSLCCLIMMDLDGFKEINDHYGHQEGDAVLKRIAKILLGAFRSEDLVARFGGDEFVVFLDHLPNRECAVARAEAVRRQVYDMMADHEEHRVSVSIGIAFGPEEGDTFALLYKHADEALYLSKRRGKNQIAFYKE